MDEIKNFYYEISKPMPLEPVNAPFGDMVQLIAIKEEIIHYPIDKNRKIFGEMIHDLNKEMKCEGCEIIIPQDYAFAHQPIFVNNEYILANVIFTWG